MVDSKFFNDKSYKLSKLSIIPTGGKDVIDITYMLTEMTLFEDIYSPTMSGEMVISDSQDLVTSLPIIGSEFINIEYSKPGGDETINKVFRIYKIDNMEINHASQTNQVYIIRFCSEETFLSISNRICKSYKGKSISDIIDDILKNQLKVDSSKINKIEKTKGTFDLILPNQYPLEAIQWLAGRSQPSSLFFENSRGFNFVSFKTLFGQKPKGPYNYIPKNSLSSATEDNEYGMTNVISYEYMDNFDTMQAQMNGMFASNMRTIDIIRQKSTDVTFDYMDHFKNTDHIEDDPNPFINDFKDRLSNPLHKNFQALQRCVITTKDHDTDEVLKKLQPNIKPNNIEQWMQQRISQMEQLNYMRMKIVIPGDVTLAVGDIMAIGVPSMVAKDPGDIDTMIHPYHSGNFLVTAIRHKINLSSYEMIVEVCKDSYPKPLTSSQSSSSTLSKAKNS